MTMTATHAKYIAAVASMLIAGTVAAGPKIDTGADRVRTGLALDMPRIGTIKPLAFSKLGDAGWMVGCECLDRDYANFEEYKDYLPALGIKKLRLQTGWAKCEKEKGVYDFAWLDKIIDWAIANGFSPMFGVGYGNPLYADDESKYIFSRFPTKGEYLEAWKRWLDALARHFAGRVRDWETWNEANNISSITAKEIADNNILTAEIVRRHIPDARISGIVLGFLGGYEDILKELKASGKGNLITYASLHLYEINPEKEVSELDEKIRLLAEYLPSAKVRMSESGAPSEMLHSMGFANWPFSEVSQAKMAMRRMLVDHSRGIDSSVFTICDLYYDKRRTVKPAMNAKGLLAANKAREVIRIKRAFYAVQNLVTLFDGATLVPKDQSRFVNNDDTIWLDEYRTKKGYPMVAFWQWQRRVAPYDMLKKEKKVKRLRLYPIPSDSFETRPFTFEATGKALAHPVLVDVFSGRVYEFPKEDQVEHSLGVVYANVPVYDSPVVLTDFAALDEIFAAYEK